MVPLTMYWPLLLVPPPSATLYQLMEYCAAAGRQKAKDRRQKMISLVFIFLFRCEPQINHKSSKASVINLWRSCFDALFAGNCLLQPVKPRLQLRDLRQLILNPGVLLLDLRFFLLHLLVQPLNGGQRHATFINRGDVPVIGPDIELRIEI